MLILLDYSDFQHFCHIIHTGLALYYNFNMNNYFEVLKVAILAFPFIAFAISLPFMLSQYHKYGSISFFKALIIYSFVLYLTCAYFLVILPLPKISEVAAMTTPRVQLVPLAFVGDFITHTSLDLMNPQTYLPALTESYFFVPIYNIILTLPFGMYLRYYFKCNLKQVAIGTFLLSLFFELTQLSGLYFIYPRGYRLFDVDDLILNTFGGIVGYFAAAPLLKILPSREQLDRKMTIKGKTVSGLRRTLAFVLDLILFMFGHVILLSLLRNVLDEYLILLIAVGIYYFAIPAVLQGSTLMEKFLRMRVVGATDKFDLRGLLLRRILFLGIYVGVPILIMTILENVGILIVWKELAMLLTASLIFIFYVVTILKFLFTTKPMLYEKLSQTKLVSTIRLDAE